MYYYSIVEGFLGKGAFGAVYKVKDSSKGTFFAMKVLDKKRLRRVRMGRMKTALDNVKTEIAVWKKLEHENVVTLYEVIDDDTNKQMFMIGELVDGGAVMTDTV